LTLSPLLILDRSDPSAFSTLHTQFQALEEAKQQQILDLFKDQDIYKMLEAPAIRDNDGFKEFLGTISLSEFEILMQIIQVMNNHGILYEKFCLLFHNLTISSSPNCTIEKQGDSDTGMFCVKVSCQLQRGDEVTVVKNFVKDASEDIGIRGKTALAEDVQVVFNALDCDGDGFLNKDEFVNALNLVTLFSKEETEDLFYKADHDCDGKIGFDDFLRFVRKYK